MCKAGSDSSAPLRRTRYSVRQPPRWSIRQRALGLALLSGTLLLGTCLQAWAQPLRVGGTGSALGTMKLLGEAFARRNPGVGAPTIVPNLGSSGAVRALRAGAIDVALVSRPPRGEEQAAGLSSFEYGRSPFALVTNKPGVKSLSSAEVANFYSGRVTVWPDGQPVRVILRPKSDGDTGYLAAMAPAIAIALEAAHQRPGMVVASTDQDAADEAEKLPGSLSTNTLALLKSEQRKLETVALDGRVPSVQAVAEGSYAHYKPFFFVTVGAPAGAAGKFAEFLRSSEGRAILEANGYLLVP